MGFIELSNIQKDALREIGNIGAGNAATSLSQLTNKRINMQVPSVKIVTFDELMDQIGGPDQVVVTILFRITGDMPATVYFLLTLDEAQNLISQIDKDREMSLLDENGELNSLAISALQEIGNILTGSYLTALADFTNTIMQPSVPHISIDMAGATLTVGLLELSQVTDYALIIDTKMNSDKTDRKEIQGQFLLLPDPDTFEKIFSVLDIDTNE